MLAVSATLGVMFLLGFFVLWRKSLFWYWKKLILNSRSESTPDEFKRNIPVEKVLEGKTHCEQSSVLICGLARNNAQMIDASMYNVLQNIAAHFKQYKILILENDSVDQTREQLLAWSEKDRNIVLIGNGAYNAKTCSMGLKNTENHAAENWRIEKMVLLRNHLLEEIEADHFNQYDYVIMIDLDLTGVVYQDGLFLAMSAFANQKECDAIASLGLELRDFWGTFKYHDPFAHEDEQTRNMTMREKDKTIYPRRGLRDHGLERVDSAFNGLTIYRRSSLIGKRYKTYLVQNKEPICEHVALHKQLSQVYIHNDFLFVMFVTPWSHYGPSNWNRSTSVFFPPLGV